MIILIYICTLLLDLFTPVLTPASSKFHFISAKQKVIMLFLFGSSVWNSLPLHIRNATTTDTFIAALNTSLFNLQESD